MFGIGIGIGIAPNPASLTLPFAPDDISGLLIWADASIGVSTSGSSVTAWADQSGNGNDLTPPSAGTRPTVATDSDGKSLIRFDGTDDYMNFNSALTTIRTVFLVIKEDSNASDAYRPLLGHATNYDFARGGSKIIFDSGNANAAVVAGTTKLSGVTIDAVNGYGLAPTKKAVISIKTTGNVTADNFANDRIAFGRVWDGDLYELIVYDSALSDANVLQVANYLKSKWVVSFSQLSMEGNSFFASYINTCLRDSLLLGGNNSAMNNAAVASSGIGNSTSAAGNYMLATARYNTLKARYVSGTTNIVAAFEGINDLYFYLTDGLTVAQAVAQVYANWLSWTQGLTALGFKVIINTCTPRENVGTPVNYETARQNAGDKQDITTINGLLRSVFDVTEGTRIFSSTDPDWANVILVDVGDDPNFGQAGDPNNATYYEADKVHPTTLMCNQIADNYYNTAINLFI